MSVGQEFHNARRVVVLIEDWDGQQHGFDLQPFQQSGHVILLGGLRPRGIDELRYLVE